MIVKLVKMGGVERFVEADQVFRQPLESGRVDLEVTRGQNPSLRFIIGEDMDNSVYPDVWAKAYLMEHGKTVDTIRAPTPPRI